MRHRIPLLKRAIPSIKKRIAKATWQSGYAIRESNGALFLLNYRNFVDKQIAFYDDFEAEQRSYFLPVWQGMAATCSWMWALTSPSIAS